MPGRDKMNRGRGKVTRVIWGRVTLASAQVQVMQSTRNITVGGFLVLLAAGLGTAGLLTCAAYAQQPPKTEAAPPSTDPKAPDAKTTEPEKRLAFEMREKPWAQ